MVKYRDFLSEHNKRLKKRLSRVGLVEKTIPSDGNCQFASISDQLYGSFKTHRVVRETVIQQLQMNPELYAHFVPHNFELYCLHMAQRGFWGDNVTLQAAADVYGTQINVITSLKDTVLVTISPKEVLSSKIIWLSYCQGVHYNSLYTREGNKCHF